MIVRKPYAFLIRHFRLLHLILFGCLAYIFINLNILRNFFVTLYNSSTLTYGDAASYYDSSLHLVALVVLAMAAIIFLLLKKKDKPFGLYLLIGIYSIAFMIVYLYLGGALDNIAKTTQSMDTIGLYRDISIMIMAPDIILIGFCFVRGIGFDVKRFNFSRDIKELEIADQDSAEYEVMIGQNTYIYKRQIRRMIREMKYYILENKMMIIFFGIGGVLIASIAGVNYYNKNFKKVETTYAEQINGMFYQVNDAWVTKFDYRGQEVSKDSKYVIVNLLVKNNNSTAESLNLNGILLSIDNLYYTPVTTKNTQFIDLGVPYANGETIAPNTTIDGLTLAFELPDKVKIQQVNRYTLKIRARVQQKSTEIFGVYKNFSVLAKSIDQDKKEEIVCLGQQFSYDDGIVKHNSARFVITEFTLGDKIEYKYVLCKSGKGCEVQTKDINVHKNISRTYGSILMLTYNMDVSEDAYFMRNLKSNGDFFAKYVYLKSQKTKAIEKTIVEKEEYDQMYLTLGEHTDVETIYFTFRNHTYIVSLDPTGEACKAQKTT